MKTRVISINVNQNETVSGSISVPENHTPWEHTGIIIAHGAGNDMDNPLLVSFSNGLTRSGCICLRFNFPYKEKGRTSPDGPTLLAETWLGAYNFLKHESGYKPSSIIAAGKSMGGLIASEMVAVKILPVHRLIFLGYPLHAPGEKGQTPRCAPIQNRYPNAFLCRHKRFSLRPGTTQRCFKKNETKMGFRSY